MVTEADEEKDMINSIETIWNRLALADRREEWSDEWDCFMPTEESRAAEARLRQELIAISEMAPTCRFDIDVSGPAATPCRGCECCTTALGDPEVPACAPAVDDGSW